MLCVLSVSAVLAKKCLWRRTKKPYGIPTPEKGEVSKQEQMDLCMVLTAEKGEVLAKTEMDSFQPTFSHLNIRSPE